MVVAVLGGEALRWGLGAYRHPLVDVYFFMSVLCEEEEVEKRWTDTRFIITRWPGQGIVMKPFLKAGQEEKDIQHILLPM